MAGSQDGCALEDVQELLKLRVAGEQRRLARKLGCRRVRVELLRLDGGRTKDAAGGPDVHWCGVVGAAQQHLGRAVPQRHNLRAPVSVKEHSLLTCGRTSWV